MALAVGLATVVVPRYVVANVAGYYDMPRHVAACYGSGHGIEEHAASVLGIHRTRPVAL